MVRAVKPHPCAHAVDGLIRRPFSTALRCVAPYNQRAEASFWGRDRHLGPELARERNNPSGACSVIADLGAVLLKGCRASSNGGAQSATTGANPTAGPDVSSLVRNRTLPSVLPATSQKRRAPRARDALAGMGRSSGAGLERTCLPALFAKGRTEPRRPIGKNSLARRKVTEGEERRTDELASSSRRACSPATTGNSWGRVSSELNGSDLKSPSGR